MSSTVSVVARPDLVRMQADRRARLRSVMADQGVDALVLLGNSNVSYVTGASWPLSDSGRANQERPVAVLSATEEIPHLFSSPSAQRSLEGLLPEDHLHPPVYVECDEGAEAFAATLAGLVPPRGRIGLDELPGTLSRGIERLLPDAELAGADDVVGVAKLVKTPDELGCLREALRITEQAIAPVQAALAPGVRQTDLTATFLRAAFDLGAEANILDPIWQVMPTRLSEGPWTTHGDIPCPLLSTERELEKDDVLWVDTGISYRGFASDFGRTWIVGAKPTNRQQAQFELWRRIMDEVLAVTRAGATGRDLTAAAMAACDGRRPWMAHFYLGHGLGIDSAESPFIGTDLGDAYDERQVLVPGMVIVFEPLVWEDGAAGYRSEEVIVVTEEGWLSLTDYPYDPYGN